MTENDVDHAGRSWMAAVALLCGALGALAWGLPAGAQELPPPAVREAQLALRRAGHDPGPVDGVPGPRTRAALMGYQQSVGLPLTGRLDPETKAKLDGASRALDGTPSHVRAVQEALRAAGHDPGPIDGIMGPRTRAALRRYAAAPSPVAPDTRRAATDEPARARSQSP